MRNSLLDLLEVTKEDLNPDLQKYRLYCDMDGVLSNFRTQYDHLFGMTPDEAKEVLDEPRFWAKIHNHGAKYWATMPWTPNGNQLWNVISKYNPTLLTAPPRKENGKEMDPVTMQGKAEWAETHLEPQPKEIIFRPSKRKVEIAQRDVAQGLLPILIDDREDTIKAWNAAGGIGLHHPENGNPSEVIKKIQELYEGESIKEGV
jgi:hypothetical protein